MLSNNFLIESESTHFGQIESVIRALLFDGIDVRITPVSRNRGLIPAHLIDSIELQHGINAWQYLRFKGIDFSYVARISDEDTLALLKHRAASELDNRPGFQGVAHAAAIDWHLTAVKVPRAWNLFGGVDQIQWTCRVGQIDTGYLPHPALGFGAIGGTWVDLINSRNFFSPEPSSGREIGSNNGLDPQTGQSWGHGTRIGATISGFAPNAPSGAFYGGAPKVPHTFVRISDCVVINDQQTALARAIMHLVDVAGVDVINLSMGIVPRLCIKAVKAALNHAYDRGVIFISAGGQYVPTVVAPACSNRTIAAGGSTFLEQFWANTSRGPEIDWAAPAADIRRATVTKPNGDFGYGLQGDGTSYATALSTSAAALWLTYHGNAINANYPEAWQRIAAFKKLGRQSAYRPKNWGDGVVGTGILNIEALLLAPLPVVTELDKEPSL